MRAYAVDAVISHTLWECCKDDCQSQWGMAKFDPQPTLNPLTDRHQIWNRDYVGDIFFREKFGLNPRRGFCPHIPEIYTQNLPTFLPVVGPMQDIVVIFDSRVGVSGTAYLTASFEFTHGWPVLPWQRYLGQIGYNSAYIRDIPEIFVHNRGFSGSRYWMTPDKFYRNQLRLPWQRNNAIWDKIGYNLACMRDI